MSFTAWITEPLWPRVAETVGFVVAFEPVSTSMLTTPPVAVSSTEVERSAPSANTVTELAPLPVPSRTFPRRLARVTPSEVACGLMLAVTETIAPPDDFARASERFADSASTVTPPFTAESREPPAVEAIVLVFASAVTSAVATRTTSETLVLLDRREGLVGASSLSAAWS